MLTLKHELKIFIVCKWAAKLRQNSIFLEKHQPGLLITGHPGGVNKYEQFFWTPAYICDLGQQGDLYTKTNLEHQSSENFNIMMWIQDLPHPRWFVPYVFGVIVSCIKLTYISRIIRIIQPPAEAMERMSIQNTKKICYALVFYIPKFLTSHKVQITSNPTFIVVWINLWNGLQRKKTLKNVHQSCYNFFCKVLNVVTDSFYIKTLWRKNYVDKVKLFVQPNIFYKQFWNYCYSFFCTFRKS